LQNSNNYDSTFIKDYNSDNNTEINLLDTYPKENINQISNSISSWIIDSGASINITNQINLLSEIKRCNEKIHLANGSTLISRYVGTFNGFINNINI